MKNIHTISMKNICEPTECYLTWAFLISVRVYRNTGKAKISTDKQIGFTLQHYEKEHAWSTCYFTVSPVHLGKIQLQMRSNYLNVIIKYLSNSPQNEARRAKD